MAYFCSAQALYYNGTSLDSENCPKHPYPLTYYTSVTSSAFDFVSIILRMCEEMLLCIITAAAGTNIVVDYTVPCY